MGAGSSTRSRPASERSAAAPVPPDEPTEAAWEAGAPPAEAAPSMPAPPNEENSMSPHGWLLPARAHSFRGSSSEIRRPASASEPQIGGVTHKSMESLDGEPDLNCGVVCCPFNGSETEALVCVFDGHGTEGGRVASFCGDA